MGAGARNVGMRARCDVDLRVSLNQWKAGLQNYQPFATMKHDLYSLQVFR